MNRRGFITGLGSLVGLAAVEPVRRIWSAGANLSRSSMFEINAAADAMRRLGEAGFRNAETIDSLSDAFGFDWDKRPDGSRVGSQRFHPPGWSDAMQLKQAVITAESRPLQGIRWAQMGPDGERKIADAIDSALRDTGLFKA